MNFFEKAIERLYFKQENNLALYDQMTGCYNRNWFIHFKHTFSKLEFYLTIVDIDNLKGTNDVEGHLAGNILISDTVKTLKNLFKPEDKSTLIRYGGDEFLLISEQDPTEILSQVNKNFSFGVSHKEKDTKIDDCFIEADNHMYRMKQNRKQLNH